MFNGLIFTILLTSSDLAQEVTCSIGELSPYFLFSFPKTHFLNNNTRDVFFFLLISLKSPTLIDSLRRRACARNVSFRISLRWLIHIINSVDKTKLSCNTPTDAAPQFL